MYLSTIQAFTLSTNLKTKLAIPLISRGISHSSGRSRVISTNTFVLSSKAKSDSTDKEPTTGWLHTKPKKWESESESKEVSDNSKATMPSLPASTKESRNHRIVSPPKIYPCDSNTKKLVITEHAISVPLSREENKEYIDVYFRIVEIVKSLDDEEFYMNLASLAPEQRAIDYITKSNLSDVSNCIIYMQGKIYKFIYSNYTLINLTLIDRWTRIW